MTNNKQVFSKTRYQLIPRVLVFAFQRKKILLIKGSPTKKIWPNLFNGIGGHIEKGEHPLAAALREFKEESGLQLVSPKLKAIVTIETDDTSIGISMHVFIGNADSGSLVSSTEGTPEWIPLNKINSLPLVEDLPWLIPAILNHEDRINPIFVHYSYDKNNNLIIESD